MTHLPAVYMPSKGVMLRLEMELPSGLMLHLTEDYARLGLAEGGAFSFQIRSYRIVSKVDGPFGAELATGYAARRSWARDLHPSAAVWSKLAPWPVNMNGAIGAPILAK